MKVLIGMGLRIRRDIWCIWMNLAPWKPHIPLRFPCFVEGKDSLIVKWMRSFQKSRGHATILVCQK